MGISGHRSLAYANKFWITNAAHTSADGFDKGKCDLIVDFGAQAAATSATAAAASETAAASSATTATTQAGNASDSATAASNSATAASGSATTATEQATAASAVQRRLLRRSTVSMIVTLARRPKIRCSTTTPCSPAPLYWSKSESALKAYDGADWQLYTAG